MVLNNVMYIDLCVDRLYTCTYLDIPGDDEDVENTGEEIQKRAENQANKPVTKFCKTNTENTTENTEQIGEDRFSYDGVCAGMPSQQYYKGTQHTKLYAHDTV